MTAAATLNAETDTALLERLSDIVSPAGVITGDGVEWYATDVYHARAMPMAVVKPASVDELRAVVRAATGAGVAIVARGGGASYTDGYLPTTPKSIMIDLGGLNRILEINRRDMYVTVEPGVTWAELSDTLAKQGLRCQFRGPFSGLVATVGGSLSQNTNGHGSNQFGTSAESVLAFEVVIASGELLKTGQAGSAQGAPFFRHFGPDLTGLFTGDCGALGIKTAITMRLARQRPAFACVSFALQDFASLHGLMSETASERIEEKSFGLDLALSQGQIGRQTPDNMIKIAAAVMESASSVPAGLASLARIAAAGTRVLAKAPYAAHYIVEGLAPAETKVKIAAIRTIAAKYGSEMPNSVPTIVNGMPFAPLHNALGPKGERWVPIHGMFAHSKVAGFHEALTRYMAGKAEDMKRHKAYAGFMFSTIGATAFLYEPAFYWEDERTPFHTHMMEPAYLASLPVYPPNPEGAALVGQMKTEVAALMHEHGAAHLQIGKFYPYLDGRNGPSVDLLRSLKAALDPHNLMNPGALGL